MFALKVTYLGQGQSTEEVIFNVTAPPAHSGDEDQERGYAMQLAKKYMKGKNIIPISAEMVIPINRVISIEVVDAT